MAELTTICRVTLSNLTYYSLYHLSYIMASNKIGGNNQEPNQMFEIPVTKGVDMAFRL